jgi:hypothetical protein
MNGQGKNNPLGMRVGWIYEAVVTTYSGKVAHAAPMGVRFLGGGTLELTVYKTAKTCANLLEKKEFTVNYTDDALLFYRSVYERDCLAFRRAKKVDAPLLTDAKAWIEAKVRETEDLGEKVRFSATMVETGADKYETHPPCMNRANSLLLECLIIATKVPHLSFEERSRAKEDIRRICLTIAKVAPASEEERLSNKIAASFHLS